MTIRVTWVWFALEVIPTDLPISLRCWANSVYHSSQVSKWVPTTRVAPIDYHCCYDSQLSTYDPGSVGHTQVDWSTEPHVSGWVVSYGQKWAWCFSLWDSKICYILRMNLWIGLIFSMLIVIRWFLVRLIFYSASLTFNCWGSIAIVACFFFYCFSVYFFSFQ